ncbi:MAG: DUF4363 family protein [Clostridia bacterium]|nr:DUF4363 family protein [Clostridia bacterium]
MYKELVISIIIVASIFVLDYITQKYTDNVINEAIQDLTSIKQAMKQESVENEKVLEQASDNYEKWLEYHKRLAFYIEHNELEKVETNYVAGKSFIENAKYEDAMSEVEKTIFVLQHINDKYSVNLENIF